MKRLHARNLYETVSHRLHPGALCQYSGVLNTLPIFEIRDALRDAVQRTRRLIIQAPTGSGKSTQVPQMLLDNGVLKDGKVVVLQPRRLATRLLAARVAGERKVSLGDEVGYQIRFEDVSSDRTRIKYETEGILLRQFMSDPEIRDVDAILFDEFHERHLYGDMTLARAVHLQHTTRPDLLLGVMSATLDVKPLEEYLPSCRVLSSQGRTYPVHVEYLSRPLRPQDDTVMEAAVTETERLIRNGVDGDVLIFMPGAYEIQRTIQLLRASSISRDCLVLPLHGELPHAEQDAAVASYDQRKIIVSTNVAETSLTIDGIRIVIDSGLARMPRFDPHRAINTLLIEKIRRASADQRAGRAGRTASGVCVRLWTEREHAERALHEVPEIKRLDLSEAVLSLKAAGIDDLRAFPWFEPPEPRSSEQALMLLTDLGALRASDGVITPLGLRMAAFPLHPRYARMMITAEEYGCVRQAALIAALTQGRSVMVRRPGSDTRKKKEDLLGDRAPSDFFILMRAWQYAAKNGYTLHACKQLGIHAQAARQVQPIFDAFLRLAKRQQLDIESAPADDAAMCKCVLAGFADHVAMRRDTGTLRCRLVHGRAGTLSRDSVVHDAPLFVAAEIDEIQSGKDLNVLLNLATRIEEAWLDELFPEAVQTCAETFYDTAMKRVVREERRLYHDLVLQNKRTGDPSPDDAARLLADEIIKGNLSLNRWDDRIEQWIHRVNGLAQWCPELGLPAFGEDERRTVLEHLCLGAFSYKDIRNRPVWPAVQSLLSGPQAALLEQHAPERLDIHGRRPFRLVYAEGQPPSLSARIQELFGVAHLPRIAMNRIQPVLHILAPNQRPVQVTHDLAGFWRAHYPRIRQELKRRYPKHAWPEQPDTDR